MKSEMLSTRIDLETKTAFTGVCDEIGMSPSQAIKIFAKAVINHGGIPFEIKTKQLNQTSIDAIKELETNSGHEIKNVEELLNSIKEEH